MDALNDFMNDSNPGSLIFDGIYWLRYMFIGVFIFFAGLAQFHILMNWTARFSVSAGGVWCLHFIIGTAWTHAVHRWFTFRGMPHHPYLISLVRTYAAYLVGLPLETVFIYVLYDLLTLHHIYACALTMILTSMFNFFIMSRYAVVKWKRIE